MDSTINIAVKSWAGRGGIKKIKIVKNYSAHNILEVFFWDFRARCGSSWLETKERMQGVQGHS